MKVHEFIHGIYVKNSNKTEKIVINDTVATWIMYFMKMSLSIINNKAY